MHSYNRTYVELKLLTAILDLKIIVSYNRTYVELKL